MPGTYIVAARMNATRSASPAPRLR
jgi:hypothetical protein